MTPKTCDKCGKIFSTNFCPDCGRKYEDIIISEPVTIETYVHGSKDDGYELCEEYGIDKESELGERLIYVNYEVKIIYEIKDNKLIARQIDSGDGQGLCQIVSK